MFPRVIVAKNDHKEAKKKNEQEEGIGQYAEQPR